MKKRTLSDYPELLKEWHPILNGDINPHEIAAGSHKKFWWICEKGHEWESIPNSRTGKDKNGCPYCANKKVCKDNCLATTHPELVKEWHPTKNDLTSNDVTVGSHKRIYWICDKNHEWQAVLNDRARRENGCPYCTNQKICKDNCLATTHPELAKEWHPTKNDLTPNDVFAGTNKKYWWICSKNHSWQSNCKNRSTLKRGCPVCNESKGEKEVARILDELNITYKREFKFNNCKNINKLPFDFVLNINGFPKAIEYHGEQHYEPCNFGSKTLCKHKNLKKIQKRDKIKRKFCKTARIPLLEISYKDFDKIEEQVKEFLDII